jgi:hypothetical protein
MPEMVLGLDISPHTVKAILLTKKGRGGGRIIATTAENIDKCGGIEPALKKIASDTDWSNITKSFSLPVNSIMFRQVTLPFSDDGKIRKTLPFELEPLIPNPADEIIADYLTAAGGGLLVAVTTKKNIREWINLATGSLGEVPVMDIYLPSRCFRCWRKERLWPVAGFYWISELIQPLPYFTKTLLLPEFGYFRSAAT